MAAALVAGIAGLSWAQAPAPQTLWNFLGIPQGAQKLKDATSNRRGNRPQSERVPPPKRIADPANLESKNPAIKTAAQIKAVEDLKAQKIKAVKYVATVGCGCYPGVNDALLAALDDCTEEVRYEAAVALCQVAGNPNNVCGKGCCNAAIMNKLHEMAYGQDEQCCNKEASPRVRAAAANALDACRRKHPPGAAPAKETGKELPQDPTEAPKKELPGPADQPPLPPDTRGIDKPVPPLPGDPNDPNKKQAASPWRVSPVGLFAEEAPVAPLPEAATGGPPQGYAAAECSPQPAYCSCDGRGCARCRRHRLFGGAAPEGAPGAVPGGPGAEAPGAVAPAPGEAAPQAQPAPTDLAGGFGTPSGPMSAAPFMIGDFFGGGSSRSTIVRRFTFPGLVANPDTSIPWFTFRGQTPVARHGPDTGLYPYPIIAHNDAAGNPPLPDVPAGGQFGGGQTTSYNDATRYLSVFDVAYDVDIPNPGAGGVVGRTKIAENTSPIPRDRLLFNYSLFDDVPLFGDGVNVHRFTPGFEKTFFHGLMSFEMKIPMATTLSSDIVADGVTNNAQGEFGNMALTWKTFLLQRETWAVTGGLMVAVPTAEDTRVLLSDGTPLVVIRNRATHLGPFLGFLWTPNDRMFCQGFFQWDVEANPNPVYIDRQRGAGLEFVRDLHDTTFQYIIKNDVAEASGANVIFS